MLQNTTKLGLCKAIHPLTRRYRLDHLDLHRNELSGKWTLDNLESRVRSIRGNLGAFVLTNGNSVEAYANPRKYQYEDTDSLRLFCTGDDVQIKLKTEMAGSFEGRHTELQN